MNRPKPKAQIFRRDSGLAEMGRSVAAERQCGVGAALAIPRFILSSILPSMRKRDLLAVVWHRHWCRRDGYGRTTAFPTLRDVGSRRTTDLGQIFAFAVVNCSASADTSGALKDAFKSKRCLVPADGFYEWTISPADRGRDPWHIFLPGPAPFSFAGLWAHNDKLGITSCTIITMPAAEPMRQLHDRQPAILDPAVYNAWLDPATPEPKALLDSNLDGELQFHRVSREVNSTKTAATRPA